MRARVFLTFGRLRQPASQPGLEFSANRLHGACDNVGRRGWGMGVPQAECEAYREGSDWDDAPLGYSRGEDRTYSGFSSKRTSLSPFTKDFRGEEHQ